MLAKKLEHALKIELPACQKVTGDLARWTVKKILQHNPHFSKRKQK